MYLHIDPTQVPPVVQVREPDDFTAFKLVVEVPEHAWIAPDVLTELAGRGGSLAVVASQREKVGQALPWRAAGRGGQHNGFAKLHQTTTGGLFGQVASFNRKDSRSDLLLYTYFQNFIPTGVDPTVELQAQACGPSSQATGGKLVQREDRLCRDLEPTRPNDTAWSHWVWIWRRGLARRPGVPRQAADGSYCMPKRARPIGRTRNQSERAANELPTCRRHQAPGPVTASGKASQLGLRCCDAMAIRSFERALCAATQRFYLRMSRRRIMPR